LVFPRRPEERKKAKDSKGGLESRRNIHKEREHTS